MLKTVAGFIAVSSLAVSTAFAAPEDIKFPKNYEKEFLNYLNLDRGNGKQVGRLFANDKAVIGVRKDGTFPDGSVLVMEVSKAKKGKDGKPLKSSLDRLIRDGKAAIVVMQKINGSGKGLPEELQNNDWEFAAFSPSGKFLKKDFDKCRACHAPLKDAKHVFSYDHLQKANLKDYLINASFKTAQAGTPAKTNNQDAVNRLLNSISTPGEKKAKPKFRSAQALLDSISLPVKRPAKSKFKSAKALLDSISAPGSRKKNIDKRNVDRLLASISVGQTKADAKRFRQNLAIKAVIEKQLSAFRRNKGAQAFAVAAPTIRKTFKNSRNFMNMVRTSFPAVYFSKRAVFPKMSDIKGKQYLQSVILEDRNGNLVSANYLMVKISGRWKIAGVELTKKRFN